MKLEVKKNRDTIVLKIAGDYYVALHEVENQFGYAVMTVTKDGKSRYMGEIRTVEEFIKLMKGATK